MAPPTGGRGDGEGRGEERMDVGRGTGLEGNSEAKAGREGSVERDVKRSMPLG